MGWLGTRHNTEVAGTLLLAAVLALLAGASAQECVDCDECDVVSIDKYFFANDVMITCTNIGAMPLGRVGIELDIDLGRVLTAGSAVSLVRSSNGTFQQCGAQLVNPMHPSNVASGHMSVGSHDTSLRLPVNQTAVDGAVAAMGPGIYDVCRREGLSGVWTNTRIKIEVQGYMLGIELNSIASNNGLTGAMPRAATPPPTLRCLPPGCPPGSTLAIIPTAISTPYGVRGADCSIVTAGPSTTQSGHLPIADDGTAGSLENLEGVEVTSNVQKPYQFCFRPAGGVEFLPTGISLIVQTALTRLQVNGVYPNGGFSPSMPKAPGTILRFDREIPGLGYRQQVQLGLPIMMYSFEDGDPTVAVDTKCDEEVCPPEVTFYNANVTDPHARPQGAKEGTGNAMGFIVGPLVNSPVSYAFMPSALDTDRRAFTVELFMKPIPCPVTAGCQQPMLTPYGNADSWVEGSVGMYYRPVTEEDYGIQVTIAGYETSQGVGTTFLRYPYFEDNIWYHVAVTFDATSGSGTPQLIVDGILWENTQPEPMSGTASIRFGPLVIGASIEPIAGGDEYIRAFRGYFDELAIFDYALAAPTISLQYNRSSAVNVDVSRRGNLLLADQDASCESFDPEDPGLAARLVPWTLESDNDMTKLILTETDKIDEAFDEGQYQVCLSSSGRPFTKTGVLLQLQSFATVLAVNRATMSLGLRSGMPRGGMSSLEILGSSAGNVTGMSLIAQFGTCDLAADNPLYCSPGSTSGHLDAMEGKAVIGTNSSCVLDVGHYQVCVRLQNGTFQATGLSVQIQAHATSFDVNGAMGGGGMRITIPRSGNGNVLKFYGNATATSADDAFARHESSGFGVSAYLMGDQTAAPPTMSLFPYARSIQISFISAGLECGNPSQNPISGLTAIEHPQEGELAHGSGHIDVSIVAATGRVSVNSEVITYIEAFTVHKETLSSAVALLPQGDYQICTSLTFGLNDPRWGPTGVKVQLQDKVAYLSVNLAYPSNGLRVAFPASTSNILSIHPPPGSCTEDGNCTSGGTIDTPVRISVIAADGDCAPLEGSVTSSNPLFNTSMASGWLYGDGNTTSVSNTTALSSLDAGAYQVCFSEAGGGWRGAGIGITIQNVILSMSVNLVLPGGGLRLGIPRVAGNIISLVAPSASASFKVVLLGSTLDCSSEGDRLTGEVLTGTGSDGSFTLSTASAFTMSNRTAGLYQVCFAESAGRDYIATGITAQTHDDLVGLSINGLDMRPSYDRYPAGVVATAPLRLGSAIFGSRLVPEGSILRGEAVSVVGASDDCALPSSNPEHALDGKSSGWMVAMGDDGSVSGGWGMENLTAGIWQVCHRASNVSSWTSSGLSLRLQGDVLGVWIDTPYYTDGLHAEYSAGLSGATTSVAFNGTTGRVSPSGQLVTSSTPGGIIYVTSIEDDCDEPDIIGPDGLSNNLRSKFITADPQTLDDITLPPSGRVNSFSVFQFVNVELMHVCFKPTGGTQFATTGVTVGRAEVPTNLVSSIYVNSAQYWTHREPLRLTFGTAVVPYGVSGNKISYELKGGSNPFDELHQFRLTPVTDADCTTGFPATATEPEHVRIRTDGEGNWNQQDIDKLFGPQGLIVQADPEYWLCYSLDAGVSSFQMANIKINRQYNAVAIRINGVQHPVQEVRAFLPRVPTGFQYRTVYVRDSPLAGDLISLISPQGQCASPYDNPASLTASSSGHITAGENGIVDVSTLQQYLFPMFFQVCIKAVDGGGWVHTSLRVEIVTKSILLPVIAASLTPNKVEIPLPIVDVTLVTETNRELVNIYVGTIIVASLYRCSSPCGDMPFGLASCPLPCTNWVDASSYLMGTTADLVGGEASFAQLAVNGTAGRLFVRLEWDADAQSAVDLPEFITYPSTLTTSGLGHLEVFRVGGLATPAISDDCRAANIPSTDTRCFGYANISAVTLLLGGSTGQSLDGLAANDSFSVNAVLVQGGGGGVDEDHVPVLDTSDMLTSDTVSLGGVGSVSVFSNVVEGGLAFFDGGTRLLVRRQAGNHFRVLFWLDGLPANSSGITVLSPPFIISPYFLEVRPWEAGGPGGGGGNFEGVVEFVELPTIQLVMKDANGRLLDHARCDDCAYAELIPQGAGDACANGFGVGDELAVGCGATVEWQAIVFAFCSESGADLRTGVVDVEVCRALCWESEACAGFTFYPEEAITLGGFPGRCWLSYGTCTPAVSIYGTVYLRPEPQLNVRDPCECPTETYDNKTLESAIKSTQVAPGTRYTPARPLAGGLVTFSGLWVKYRQGKSLRLSLKLAGVPITAITPPIVHVPGPSEPFSYGSGSIPQPTAQCACSARQGLDMLDLGIPPSSPGEFYTVPGAEFAEDYTVQSLLELQALGCRCYLPDQAQGTCFGYCSV